MTVHMIFTEQEERYLVKEPFNWHASETAPDSVKKSIKQKLRAIDEQQAVTANSED